MFFFQNLSTRFHKSWWNHKTPATCTIFFCTDVFFSYWGFSEDVLIYLCQHRLYTYVRNLSACRLGPRRWTVPLHCAKLTRIEWQTSVCGLDLVYFYISYILQSQSLSAGASTSSSWQHQAWCLFGATGWIGGCLWQPWRCRPWSCECPEQGQKHDMRCLKLVVCEAILVSTPERNRTSKKKIVSSAFLWSGAASGAGSETTCCKWGRGEA